MGVSDKSDPYSGKPYFAYRTRGANATTTDMTRISPEIDPRIAAPADRSAFENPRMPEGASQGVRARMGATDQEQLDHRMALALGGSNADENLKPIPTAQNQAAGKDEGTMSADVAAGKTSLFEAQVQEAKNKGLPAPFTDQPITEDHVGKARLLSDIFHAADDDKPLGLVKNFLEGLWPGSKDSVIEPTAISLARSIPQSAASVMESIQSTPGPKQAATAMESSTPMTATQDQTSITPSTPMEKFLWGDQTIPDIHGVGEEALKQYGASDETSKKYGLPLGMALTAVNLFPGTSGEGAAAEQSIKNLAEQVIEHAGGETAAVGGLTENEARNYVRENYDTMRQNYIDHVTDEFGTPNVISKDSAKHVIPGHTPELSPVYHPAAGDFTDKYHDELLQSQKGKGNNTVLYTGGATGVGKTSGLKNVGIDLKDHPIVYDSNLQADSSPRKFQSAIDNGYKVRAVFTHRDPVQSWVKGVVPRVKTEGRIVTEGEHVARHTSVPENVAAAHAEQAKHGSENMDILHIDNTGGKNQAKVVPLDKIPHFDYNDLHGRIAEETNKAEQHGAVTKEQAAAIRGNQGKVLQDSGRQGVVPQSERRESVSSSQRTGLRGGVSEIKRLGEDSSKRPAGTATRRVEVSIPEEQESEIGSQVRGSRTERNVAATRAGDETPREKPQIRQTIPVRDIAGHPVDSSVPTAYDSTITEHNGGVEPPVNKGGLEAPQIDWTKTKDIAAIRLSTDTMERNVEKIFGKQADTVNNFLTEKVRANETARAKFVTDTRKEISDKVVKGLGIRARSPESALVQHLGEGNITMDNVTAAVGPEKARQVQAAVKIFRDKYDEMHSMWNQARADAGMGPIGKIPNYFRHFPDFGSFMDNFIPTTSTGKLPTAISGITDYFKSRTPWSSAAMRRTGVKSAVDAVSGMDNYLDVASRAIFHTDSVQRGRLLEKYLRDTAKALPETMDPTAAVKTGVQLPNFASNLNDWTNLVSGKQARLDRAVESVVGRPALAFMRGAIRKFGLNVIGGNVSAATTHSIPLVYTLATTDTDAAFRGLMSTLSKPFMQDFATIGGQDSAFLTRRFATKAIDPTMGEKVGTAISKPFQWVDQFISHFAVASKFEEGIGHGLSAKEAMAQADNYAARVIGDRSTGNLPNLMNTKTLGMITQFQIEVNDNLRVLMHDVPRWANNNPAKIAGTFAKFAVYSYMFNQVMHMVKGSGKGLDPINMGMTLAGLNEEGQGKDAMGRLGAFGTELAGELPFTSIITQGQYPVLQGLPLADVAKGNYGTAAQKFASSFVSPVGGGVQALKTYKGIQAWRAGVLLDSSGKVITPIPQTLPNLLQGSLFGTNAWTDVRKSQTELGKLSDLIKMQQATSKAKNQQASQIATDLGHIQSAQGGSAAASQLTAIADKDPDMAKRVLTAIKNQAAGMTKADLMVKNLGIANGQRALYIKQKLSALPSNDEKQAYLLDLANKKLLTAEVLQQVLAQ